LFCSLTRRPGRYALAPLRSACPPSALSNYNSAELMPSARLASTSSWPRSRTGRARPARWFARSTLVWPRSVRPRARDCCAPGPGERASFLSFTQLRLANSVVPQRTETSTQGVTLANSAGVATVAPNVVPSLSSSCLQPGGTPHDLVAFTFLFANNDCDVHDTLLNLEPAALVHPPNNSCANGVFVGLQQAPPAPMRLLWSGVCSASGAGVCNFASSAPASDWCPAHSLPLSCGALRGSPNLLWFTGADPLPTGVCFPLFAAPGMRGSFIQFCGMASVPAQYLPLLGRTGQENCLKAPPLAFPTPSPTVPEVSVAGTSWHLEDYIKPTPNRPGSPSGSGAATSMAGDGCTFAVGAVLDRDVPLTSSGVFSDSQRPSVQVPNPTNIG
jgi:hypothetical protein